MLMVAVFIMPLEVADPSDLHTILFRYVGLSSHPVRKGKRVMGSNPIETSLLFDIIPSSPVVCSWFVRICYHSLISPIWINRMTKYFLISCLTVKVTRIHMYSGFILNMWNDNFPLFYENKIIKWYTKDYKMNFSYYLKQFSRQTQCFVQSLLQATS